MATRVFLLSPARIGGPRSSMLLRPEATFELATKLRQGSATFGEVYSFVSGLYFRGKMAYAEAFGAASTGIPSALIIVPGMGLIAPSTLVTTEQLSLIGSTPIERSHQTFRSALLRDARALKNQAGRDYHIVLLGSIATDKYTEPLLEIFGGNLLFPADFVGRGDMSRGGLMLRAAGAGRELEYIPVIGATRHGSRPPKLTPLRR